MTSIEIKDANDDTIILNDKVKVIWVTNGSPQVKSYPDCDLESGLEPITYTIKATEAAGLGLTKCGTYIYVKPQGLYKLTQDVMPGSWPETQRGT